MAYVSTAQWSKGDSPFLPSHQWSGNDKFKAFDEIVVKGDTWATFMAFSNAWEKLNYKEQNELKKYLPSVLDEVSENYEDVKVKPSIEANLKEVYFSLQKDLNNLAGGQNRIENYLGSIIVFLFFCLIIFFFL